ncbi:MAG: UDP-N-acetylmuramate dehydrogenase [Chitinophagales bacterium]|nr:UDP-N-acetylmuramate dehydrogenase [Chitinophagales bacterium]
MTRRIEENTSLKNFNTFGIDVKARYFFRLTKLEDLFTLDDMEVFKEGNFFVLGGGSNILFTSDYEGLIIKNELKGHEVIAEDDHTVTVEVMAGENWHEFVLMCVGHNWGGIENLSLIPGCLGAAPIQNIGAYGVELKDVFKSTMIYDIEQKQQRVLDKADCNFGYRDSIFKHELKGKIIVLSVTLTLSKNPIINISYGAIQKTLEERGIDHPGIKDVSDAVITIRSSKLPNPDELGNAGSFFKNPVISISLFNSLKKTHENIPSYPVDESRIKIPAAWLIEHAGWKGYRDGDIGTHVNQPLVLVNYNSARGEDIDKLSETIRTDIKDKFGILLEKEVNIL